MMGSMTPIGSPAFKWVAVAVAMVVVAFVGSVIFEAWMTSGPAPLPPNSRPLIMLPMRPG